MWLQDSQKNGISQAALASADKGSRGDIVLGTSGPMFPGASRENEMQDGGRVER
jgi:hypothetical protein